MQATNAQVRKLMEEYQKNGKLGQAAMKAGMHRETARKYLRTGKLPSQLKQPRAWRTRKNPFDPEHWADVEQRLSDAPELEAGLLFDYLLFRYPDRYEPGQLRSFQRRVKDWRATKGPDKVVSFPQQHRPGEAMQTDFTVCNHLGVTINGRPFDHMLCHPVLPYSNWEWATVCQSESYPALKHGVQEAVFRLGRVAEWHQTDNSSAATHEPRIGMRKFNRDYAELISYLGMKPRTIGIGQSQQNGDVEALNGALKNRLKQHLALRRSRDFESVEEYVAFLHQVLRKANRLRKRKLADELRVMAKLRVSRLPSYSELSARVTIGSTIRVKANTYSVPSRLVGEQVRVRIYDDRIEVWYGGSHQLTAPRLTGKNGHRIDYRHLIWSLVRKPGAFARYRYRDALFPTLVFRKAYDRLVDQETDWDATLEYLRILLLAASTTQADVEIALELLLEAREPITSGNVKALVSPAEITIPDLAEPTVDLSIYDQLLTAGGAK